MAPLLFRGTRATTGNNSSSSPASAPFTRANDKLASKPRLHKSRKSCSDKAAAPSPASSTRYLLNGVGGDEDYSRPDYWLPEADDPLPDLIQLDSSRLRRAVVEDDDEGEFFARLDPEEQIRLCSAPAPASVASTWPRFQTVCDDSAVLKPSIFSVHRGKDVGGGGKGDGEVDSVPKPQPPVLSPLLREEFDSGEKGLDEKTAAVQKPSSSPGGNSEDEVVVLRVSLHCKGCEGKVRRHLKRMEGVTSFNIDFKAKKVTVIGNVTPLTVLSSISKVKNAQLWIPPPLQPPPPPVLP